MPCPIVYGAIVDSACLMWDSVCGKQGACRLYDTKMFRIFFHGTVKILTICYFSLRIEGAFHGFEEKDNSNNEYSVV